MDKERKEGPKILEQLRFAEKRREEKEIHRLPTRWRVQCHRCIGSKSNRRVGSMCRGSRQEEGVRCRQNMYEYRQIDRNLPIKFYLINYYYYYYYKIIGKKKEKEQYLKGQAVLALRTNNNNNNNKNQCNFFFCLTN